MPCKQTTTSEVGVVDGEWKFRSGAKIDAQSTKKVTFCIPNNGGDEMVENRDDPEWIKMAEAKCKKTIKWDDLDKQQVIPKSTNSTTTWITQVHLKHVPVSLEGSDDAPEVESAQPRIKVNLRHVAVHQTEVKMRVEEARREEEEEGEGLTFGGVRNGQEGAGGEGPREEPDWMKLARQKKQVRVDWEQLESSKRFGSERHLAAINEDNQSVNGYFSHHLYSEQTNSLSKSNGKSKTNLDAKCAPYRTWVVSKQKTKESENEGVGHKWLSEPQLNTIPVATKPQWFQLAEKKRNSMADWSALDRGLSPMSSGSAYWMQEVRLRTPSPTPSPNPELEDEPKCTSPFPIQLRHVEERLKPEVTDEEEEEEDQGDGHSPWISRANSTETDKWQIRYRELFEDLSDEPSPTDDSTTSATATTTNADHYQALPTNYLPINSPQTRSTTSSPRKFRNLNLETNQQRRRLDFHHRYYSLPEMNALPLSANELQIVSLNKSESSLSVDERPPTIPESPSSEDNEVLEEKLVPFVRLRPTGKKEPISYDLSPSNEDLEPFWMKEIKLRKVPVRESDEMPSKLSHSFSEHLNKAEPEVRLFPANRMPRAVSAPSHISSGLSVREAIHRDLKREVARREQRKSNGRSKQSDGDYDTSSESSFTSVSELSVQLSRSSTSSKTNSMETLIIKNNSEEKSIGSVHHKKPLWLEELKQKKSVLKPIEQNGHSKNQSNKPPNPPSLPSFENVLEEIKLKGKDRLFSNLRPGHRRPVQSFPDPKTDYSSSSESSLSSTPLSALSDNDDDSTISKHEEVEPVTISGIQETKSKPLRPVSAPITVNHILQQHSTQLINGNSFSARKNGGDSPNKESVPLNSVDEDLNSQEDDVTIEEEANNKDFQANNKDFQATNKDFQATNEDFQATNEDFQETEDDFSEKTFSVEDKGKQSLEDLKSPLLLLDLLSRISKSCSETNLTGLGAPSSAKSRFEAATSRMTSSCSNLAGSSVSRKHKFHQYDDLSWSSGASVVQAQTNSSNHELPATVASSSSASDLEVYEEAESETYENCKSEFSLQLKPSNLTSNSKRNASEISLD